MTLMNDERFWTIIAESRSEFDPNRRDGNMDSQVARLRDALSELSAQDVGSFANTLTNLFHDAYQWDLWAAGYIIEGGCSDDGFCDFRYWLISMGRDVYCNAITDVESLADVAFAPGIEVTRFEESGYIAHSVLRGMNASEDDAGITKFKHPVSPAGEEWEEEELPTRFPKLIAAEARYGV
ncbi:WGR domain protein [Rhodopirellula maiorica SM1]|uniref:WGR domain protein n=1 Tax=Rhodopirellula maiorica SM1 TaxID=1265738 RepID=M5RXZ7_9BACT|nr:DUF4240 domain-containing protein [Rhodopirellula maiorica]EMI18784.1 WGR domain protein [Rhodopirellula maiorica SM1]